MIQRSTAISVIDRQRGAVHAGGRSDQARAVGIDEGGDDRFVTEAAKRSALGRLWVTSVDRHYLGQVFLPGRRACPPGEDVGYPDPRG